MSVAERITAAEFLALPVPERGRPWNLVEGEVVLNEPTFLHQEVKGAVYSALCAWTRASEGRGKVILPIDIQLDERNVFAPDVLWYAEDRAPSLLDAPPYPMPDLAVEVRSPTTWHHDIGAKKSSYERHGLPELWLVDPAADAVLVFRRSSPRAGVFDLALELGREQRLDSPLLPGLTLSISEILPRR